MGIFNPKFKESQDPEYVSNRHLGKRTTLETFEDEYTIKQRQENLIKDLHSNGNETDFYVDAENKKTPLHELNGQNEKLLREARRSIAS